jgi:hypothetical protein
VLFKDLTQLPTKVDQLLAQLTPETLASITGYNFILDALSVTNLFKLVSEGLAIESDDF